MENRSTARCRHVDNLAMPTAKRQLCENPSWGKRTWMAPPWGSPCVLTYCSGHFELHSWLLKNKDIFWIILSKKFFTQIIALWQVVRRSLPWTALNDCYLLEKIAVPWLTACDCLKCNAWQESIVYSHTAKLSAIKVLSPKGGLQLAEIIYHGISDCVRGWHCCWCQWLASVFLSQLMYWLGQIKHYIFSLCNITCIGSNYP